MSHNPRKLLLLLLFCLFVTVVVFVIANIIGHKNLTLKFNQNFVNNKWYIVVVVFIGHLSPWTMVSLDNCPLDKCGNTVWIIQWGEGSSLIRTLCWNFTGFKSWIKLYCVPDGKSEVDGGEHGEAGNGDHAHEDVGEEPQVFIIKQAECSEKAVALMDDLEAWEMPDSEGEDSSDDEDIIKHGESNEESVESLLELFPPHNNNSDSVA